MLYCLFRHGAAALFADLFVRVGERILVKRIGLRVLQELAQRIGIKVTHRILGRGVVRWISLVGAIGIAWYSKYDTRKVGETANDLFKSEVAQEGRSSSSSQ
jgi:hypothetical protein